jgi:hypothetical protein
MLGYRFKRSGKIYVEKSKELIYNSFLFSGRFIVRNRNHNVIYYYDQQFLHLVQ